MYFNEDRKEKYLWGSFRLLIFLIFCYTSFPISYLFAFCYIGFFGSLINTKIIGLLGSIISISFIIVYCTLWFGSDIKLLIYALKTFLGDFITKKITISEFCIIFGLISILNGLKFINGTLSIDYSNISIFLKMFIIHIICEYGDNNLERYIFFRHRYSYDLLNMLLYWSISEKEILMTDIIISFFYRFFNFCLCSAIIHFHSGVINDHKN